MKKELHPFTVSEIAILADETQKLTKQNTVLVQYEVKHLTFNRIYFEIRLFTQSEQVALRYSLFTLATNALLQPLCVPLQCPLVNAV